MKDDKRAWSKPELIVLVRSQPEESVLAACKVTKTGGPLTAMSGCDPTGMSVCYTPRVS